MNIAWKITKLYVEKQQTGLSNRVVAVDWECVATDKTFTSKLSGKCQAPENLDPGSFRTDRQILSWCWESCINKAVIERSVLIEVNKQVDAQMMATPLS